MKKIFTFLAAALMSVSMFGKLVQEDLSLAAAEWGWGYNCQVSNQDTLLSCSLTGEWGAVSTGWDPERDLSEWDKIIILVENMSGCDGEWFKLKAYLRDSTESEANQMEGLLGLDAQDNAQNYLVIDLNQNKACDLTAAKILAIQCQPNGAVFKISRVYLEKEEEDDPEVERELAKIGVNFPTADCPADDKIQMAGTFAEGTMTMEKIVATGWFVSYDFVNAAADDTFKFRDATNNDKVLCKYIPANGDAEGKWVQAIFKFGNYWQADSWKGTPCKVIEEDLSDANQYAWKVGMPEPDPEESAIENIVMTEKVTKVVVDGMVYIVRDGKLFTTTGVQVR